MAPKKKQQAHNAFYYFMMDFKSKQGKNCKSMQEVSEAASPHWNNMTKEQKRPFEEKALMEKNRMRGGKFTSEGLDVELLERQEKEEQMRIQEMRNDINYNLSMASKSGHLQDELFFIIHINTFCYCTSEDRHYPAEIAIACFSLEDGVLPQNVFHRVIKPGMLPLGYAGEAISHSNATHQLPPPMAGEYENNIDEVYSEMKHFLSTRLSGSKRMPVLYAEGKMMQMIQHVLNTWCYDFGEEKALFKVYNLQYMLRALRNTVADENVWPSDTFSTREIEKDVYAYARGICCEYHEVSNVSLHCSRSVAVRYAYIICDNCCPDLNIILVPGTHLPDTAMTPSYRSSSRASDASSVSSRSSRSMNSKREDDSESVMSFSSKSEWDNQSVTSETSTLDSEENFPSLGARRKVASSPNSGYHMSPNDSSSQSSSVRSYAGAIGTSGLSRRPMDMPSSLSSNAGSQVDPPKSVDNPMGRGRGNSFNNDSSNFPALGRGRGLAMAHRKRADNTE